MLKAKVLIREQNGPCQCHLTLSCTIQIIITDILTLKQHFSLVAHQDGANFHYVV